jgi:hypothetical protein
MEGEPMSASDSVAVEAKIFPADLLRRLTETCPSRSVVHAIERLESAKSEEAVRILCETIAQLSGHVHRIRAMCVSYIEEGKR